MYIKSNSSVLSLWCSSTKVYWGKKWSTRWDYADEGGHYTWAWLVAPIKCLLHEIVKQVGSTAIRDPMAGVTFL